MSSPNSKLGPVHWRGWRGRVDLGHLALPRKKDAVPEGETKPRMGGGRGRAGEGIFCKNKSFANEETDQTSAGCPRALGLEADAVFSQAC